MKFFQDNYIKNFPDCYDKGTNSNFYKIMQLLRYDEDNFRAVLQELHNCLDLDDATGFSLDLYGEMLGQLRDNATDDQYRALIKLKIAQQRSEIDCNSIINTLSSTLGVAPEQFKITDAEISGFVDIEIPVDTLMGAGLSIETVYKALKQLLTAGVGIRSINITQEVKDAKLAAGTAGMFTQNFILDIEAMIGETATAVLYPATALMFAENYFLEVV